MVGNCDNHCVCVLMMGRKEYGSSFFYTLSISHILPEAIWMGLLTWSVFNLDANKSHVPGILSLNIIRMVVVDEESEVLRETIEL